MADEKEMLIADKKCLPIQKMVFENTCPGVEVNSFVPHKQSGEHIRGDGAVHYETIETPGIEDHPYFTQTAEGVQYIANMREGATAVFKYFDITPGTKITAKHTGKGEMEIRAENGTITFVYHGADAADFYSFSFDRD